MKVELAAAVRDEFAALIRQRTPKFIILRGEAGRIGDLYVLESPVVNLFVFLQMGKGRADEFTIRIGWSREKTWPGNSHLPHPPPAGTASAMDAGWFTLGRLSNATGDDLWWRVPRKDAVAVVVADAFGSLEEKGIPYLWAVASGSDGSS